MPPQQRAFLLDHFVGAAKQWDKSGLKLWKAGRFCKK
jgi:hypothetical protein